MCSGSVWCSSRLITDNGILAGATSISHEVIGPVYGVTLRACLCRPKIKIFWLSCPRNWKSFFRWVFFFIITESPLRVFRNVCVCWERCTRHALRQLLISVHLSLVVILGLFRRISFYTSVYIIRAALQHLVLYGPLWVQQNNMSYHIICFFLISRTRVRSILRSAYTCQCFDFRFSALPIKGVCRFSLNFFHQELSV